MKEKNLVIGDDDTEYVSRLGRYISSRDSVRIRVACFSDKDLMREYVNDNPVDMILAGESWISEDICPDSRKWMLLSEQEGGEQKNGTVRAGRQIYRYQPADDILTKILQGMALPGAGGPGADSAVFVVGVYGPAGWTETSRLALAMAARLGREGPSVYLGLNEFSPVMKLTGKPKGYDLSDVAYCWRRGRLTDEQLERMAGHEDGFDCIPAPVNPAELAELGGQELEELIKTLCGVGGYQNVVADFGNGISGRTGLFEACWKTIVIFPETETGQLQKEEFVQFWESVGAGDLLRRAECVMLPPEELRPGRRGRAEEYMNELAGQLLRGKREDGREGGIVVCRGD